MTQEDLIRFMSHVEKQPTPNGCWLWTGATYEGGYGCFVLKGDHIGTHRAIYEHCFGVIIDSPLTKWEVCHECDTPACVNPAHLFTASHQGNAQDMVKKGRAGAAKLTPDMVKEIKTRLRNGEKSEKLRKEFGITQPTMWRLKNDKAWRGV